MVEVVKWPRRFLLIILSLPSSARLAYGGTEGHTNITTTTTTMAIYCWGNTAHGELGLGGIEEEQVGRDRAPSNGNPVSS